jgi:hypothetical protein
VSVEQFQRRADECRRLAAAARNASDKAFWLGLVQRWQALETQKARQLLRDKSGQRELSAEGRSRSAEDKAAHLTHTLHVGGGLAEL